MAWKEFDGESIDQSILNAVSSVISDEAALGNNLKVCIGTDSQIKTGVIHFATVIVFLRKRKGAFMYTRHERSKKKMTIKERMLAEVQRSIAIAYSLCPLLEKYQIDLEVHADINTNPTFRSNQALHEAMGYSLSMGLVFKAKPDAFASSACANRMVQ